MEHEITLTIGEEDFIKTFGRKPKDIKEFKTFAGFCVKGLLNGHIDMKMVFECAKDEMI